MSNHLSPVQVDIQREYDLVQLIGEGWFSRVYLAEHRGTREEVSHSTLRLVWLINQTSLKTCCP